MIVRIRLKLGREGMDCGGIVDIEEFVYFEIRVLDGIWKKRIVEVG